MNLIQENVDITHLNTFGIRVRTRYFAEYKSERELLHITRQPEFVEYPILQIGGGSNLLFLRDFDGLVLHSAVKGITRYDKDADTVYVIAGAGENWADFVEWTVSQGLAGLENLSGIPGEVGASPVQNVGAYGVEAGDVIHSVECFDLSTRKTCRFLADECRFAYRDSLFKHEGRGRYIVLRVSFKLRPDGVPRSLEYGPLAHLREELGQHPTLRQVADEVLRVRNSKLPDPAIIGSAGSFFKNPVVHNGKLEEIKALTGHELSGHPVGEHYTKLSAAWLIDHAGMKGARCGGAKVYDKQPLVIVNDSDATAQDVATLATMVSDAVRRKFLVDLRPEVNYIDTAVHVTILGTGTSKGIPEIGCACRVCTSPYQKDKRTRCSAIVRTMGQTFLIDPSPDFREQMLRENVHDIDAVLITHAHYDHVGGIDDLRPYCYRTGGFPIYCQDDVEADLRHNYPYCFAADHYPGAPVFGMHRLKAGATRDIAGVEITPLRVFHGRLPILGFRMGQLGYITDAKTLPLETIESLRGVDTLVINALRIQEHHTHMNLSQALDVINSVGCRQAYLTHISHDMGLHSSVELTLPQGVYLAYDGLEITIG